MNKMNRHRKSPSRESCENSIRRILTTEVLQNGRNLHFRTAADFMDYFESLYTPSDALTKQVQRAIRSLNMPKDEKGYYIVNKTSTQLEQEDEIRKIFSSAHVYVDELQQPVESVFLRTDPDIRSYIIYLIEHSDSFKGKYLTIVESCNGLILYTQCKSQLLILLNSLTN